MLGERWPAHSMVHLDFEETSRVMPRKLLHIEVHVRKEASIGRYSFPEETIFYFDEKGVLTKAMFSISYAKFPYGVSRSGFDLFLQSIFQPGGTTEKFNPRHNATVTETGATFEVFFDLEGNVIQKE